MTAVDIIKKGLQHSRGTWERALKPADAQDGPIPELPRAQMLWRPAPGSHSVGKLLWHIADVEDRLVQSSLKGEEFTPRFAIHSLDDNDDEAIPQWDELIAYANETRARTLSSLDDFADRLSEARSFFGRPSTVGEIFTLMITHEASHAGQIAHIMGVIRRAGW